MTTPADKIDNPWWRTFWFKNFLNLVPYRFKTPRGYVIRCRRRYEVSMCQTIFSGTHYPFHLINTPIRTVLDVGANIGVFSFFCADKYADTLDKLVAVEPFTKNYKRIVRRVAKHGLQNRIQVVNQAVSNQPGTAELRLGAAHYSHSLQETKVSQPKGLQSVEVTTIDKIAAASGIERFDLVKIDVEGMELAAIEGGTSVLGRASYLIIESHRNFCTLADLKRVLPPCGLIHRWPENAAPDSHGDFFFVRST